MLMRIPLRTKLVGLVGGLFVIAVLCMAGSGCALGVRVVNGVGELLCFWIWEKSVWAGGGIYLRFERGVWGTVIMFLIVAYVHSQFWDILIL